jgi:hypothetical protein
MGTNTSFLACTRYTYDNNDEGAKGVTAAFAQLYVGLSIGLRCFGKNQEHFSSFWLRNPTKQPVLRRNACVGMRPPFHRKERQRASQFETPIRANFVTCRCGETRVETRLDLPRQASRQQFEPRK